jgi:hypothetical protein
MLDSAALGRDDNSACPEKQVFLGVCLLVARNSTSLHHAPGWSDGFEVFFRFLPVGEETLFQLKFAGMYAAAAATYLHGMLQVQHLVVKEILYCVTRSVLAVKDSTDHDRVVRWIIVTQTALGHVPTPGEQRPAH